MRTAETIERDKAAKSDKPVESNEASTKKPGGCTGKGFLPGQSGNPGGKPKIDVAKAIARAVFERDPEALIEAFVQATRKGNAYAFKELADRAYGKVTDKLEVSETQPTQDADLATRIAQLERDLGLAREIDEAGRVGLAKAGAGKANGEAKD